MEQTECSETFAYKIQTPGNYPEGNIQHTEHGESLKSRMVHVVCLETYWYSIMYVTFILFINIFNNLERNVSAKYVMPYRYGCDIYSMYKYNIIIEHLKVLIYIL